LARGRRRCLDGRVLQGAAALGLCAFATAASAQFSGTATVVSDYRYRGITLSGKRPAAQLGVTYDNPVGWYVGAFGSTVRFLPPVDATTQATAFAGFASRVSSGVSIEAGGDYSVFDDASRYNYGNVYLGIATENISGRIYYSPRYFGLAASAVYAEINYTHTLVDRLRWFAHGGFLRTSADTFYAQSSDRRYVDGRIGLGVDFDQFQAELAWVGISRAYAGYRITNSTSQNTVMLTLSRAF
jgi:uncharacterized protein (TIGR02001 family)